MYLYLDETGSFDVPRSGGHSLCAVGALSIPESSHAAIIDGLVRLTAEWQLTDREPKGRILREEQFERFFDFLARFNVVLSLVAIDMGMHTEAQLADHKARQVERIRQSVKAPIFYQSMRDSVNELADRLAALSLPLYVQSVLLTQLVGRALQVTTLHFAQTDPPALGAFRWRIDAKDIRLTPGEKLWMDVIKPMTQTYFLQNPLLIATDLDYSAMAPFENEVCAEPPSHLKGLRPEDRGEGFHSFDARKIMDSDMTFVTANDAPGLNLVDIAVSAFRRACQGRLQARGWKGLGRLIVRDLERDAAIHLVRLGPAGMPATRFRVPYADVYEVIQATSLHWDMSHGPRRPHP